MSATPSPELRRRRLFLIGAVAVIVGTLAFLAYGNIGGNLVYYWSPSEMLAAGDDAKGASIRLGGLVEPGSIRRDPDGLTLSFSVIDQGQSVRVSTQAVPPAMFRESIGVLLEGTLREDGTFVSDRLMVKHDNQYQAPDSEDDRDLRELMESMQFGPADT
jgi:cytochrome c-type biogenesis protein CcmE